MMSTLGVFMTPGRYHEYTGECSVHWEIIMSTLGAYQMHLGVFRTLE